MRDQYMHLWEYIQSLLFPPRCPICDEILPAESRIIPTHYNKRTNDLKYQLGIHPSCSRQIYRIPKEGAICMKCGKPLVELSLPASAKDVRLEEDDEFSRNPYAASAPRMEFCYDCSRHQHNYIQGKALYLYRGEIKVTMYHFKYSNRREYAVFFAREAVQQYGSWLAHQGVDVIIPIPMYESKRKRRGYNQAEVFARALTEETGIHTDSKIVKRIRNTTPQKELNDQQRKNNLKNAFHVDEFIVKYSKILLVDDIYTTGSTMDAVAHAIQQAGVDQIYFLCVCIGKGL